MTPLSNNVTPIIMYRNAMHYQIVINKVLNCSQFSYLNVTVDHDSVTMLGVALLFIEEPD